ncbi:integrator complex subunit 6 isoform X3 [Scyliorhinus torazame]|uniref:integrator complex subunit 6 isoform X3 n=1 Tax=Scyliorhinus torazame TaxID=75743 RepID=UPI003B5A5C36
MPILLFLIDTSASMSQRTHLGTTYLDIAKGAVETFMKLRARDPASRGDRYMLVTFDDPPYGIKAGWKENHATFMNELKNLQAVGLSTLGQSLRTSFDLLNLNRLVTGIDNYGQSTQFIIFQLRGNLAWPIHLPCTSLGCGGETHANTGRMCKLHTDSDPEPRSTLGPRRREAAMLSTATVLPLLYHILKLLLCVHVVCIS